MYSRSATVSEGLDHLISCVLRVLRMFRHFSEVKNKAQEHHDDALNRKIDEIIDQWTQVPMQREHVHRMGPF